MNPVDRLPDNWFEVSHPYVCLVVERMRRKGVKMDEYCLMCPLCKPSSMYIGSYICCCFNKCIKEYPTINDNEEFL